MPKSPATAMRIRQLHLTTFACALLCALATTASHADPADCTTISDANHRYYAIKDSRNTMKASGFDFVKYTPQIYSNNEVCAFLRNETVAGDATKVYSQRFSSSAGTTYAEIWISTKSGLPVREELDGDITGKGKGHLSMVFLAH